MELSDLIEICKAWDRMGWAVQSQAEAVVGGQPLEEQNPNALAMVQEWLKDVQDKMAWVADGDDIEAIREQAVNLDRWIAEHLLALRLAA